MDLETDGEEQECDHPTDGRQEKETEIGNGLGAADPNIGEAALFHIRGIVNISKINE